MAEKYLKGDGVTADKNKALGLVEKAASKGYAQALCRLGDFYAEGKVVNRNLTKAIKYYIEAMNEGYLSPEAAKRLSDCYKQGLGGLTIDKIMAEKVLKKAIDQNPVINLLNGLTFEWQYYPEMIEKTSTYLEEHAWWCDKLVNVKVGD